MNKLIVSNDFEKTISNLQYSDLINVDELKVEDVKKIKDLVYIKSDSERVIVIAAKKYNVFSQNALLKLLEEPPQGVTFILIAKSKYSLLDTIKSRLIIENEIYENRVDFDLELIDFDNSDEVLKFLKRKLDKDEFLYFLKLLLQQKNLNDKQLTIISKAIEMLELNFDKEVVLSWIIMSLRVAK